MAAVFGVSGGSATASKQDSLERRRAVALGRAVYKICRKGKCQRSDLPVRVRVWRDKKGAARVLEYRTLGCSDGMVTFHDASGKFLVEEQTGPREPDEWDSPDDRKITRLLSGLTKAESYSCHNLPSLEEQ
jgi:hypothetical protein